MYIFLANFTKIGENTLKGHSLVLKKWNWHFFHFWHVFASAGFEPVTLKNQINEYFLYHIQGFEYRTLKTCKIWKNSKFEFFTIELFPNGLLSPILVKFAQKLNPSLKKVPYRRTLQWLLLIILHEKWRVNKSRKH